MIEAEEDPTRNDPTGQGAGATSDDDLAAHLTDDATDQVTADGDDADREEDVQQADDRDEGDQDRGADIDLIGIESDLDGVQAALVRLADGTYWTDEVTGEPIPVDVLAANPLTRRA